MLRHVEVVHTIGVYRLVSFIRGSIVFVTHHKDDAIACRALSKKVSVFVAHCII